MMANRGSKHVEGVESIMQTKNVNKNARKRANKAKKQVEGKSEGDNAEADAASDAVAAMSVQEVSAPAETAAPPAAAAAETAPQDPAKRLRCGCSAPCVKVVFCSCIASFRVDILLLLRQLVDI